jgi:hypothetical protein
MASYTQIQNQLLDLQNKLIEIQIQMNNLHLSNNTNETTPYVVEPIITTPTTSCRTT